MNAHVLLDPQMQIFLVACTNSDTLMQKKTFAFTNMFLFLLIAACSCNSEFYRHKHLVVDSEIHLQH